MDRIKVSSLHRSGNCKLRQVILLYLRCTEVGTKARIKVQGWYKYGFHPMGGNVQIKPNAHKWEVTSGLVQLCINSGPCWGYGLLDELGTSGAAMEMVMVKSPVAVLHQQWLCSSGGGWIAMP
jgi:hypothetical protein